MIHLVLTLIGDDRPGLVNAAARVVAAHGGTWLESRAARLAGKFAGVVLIGAPAEQVEALSGALRELAGSGLKVTVEPGAVSPTPSAAGRILEIEVVGNERPGIVRDLTQTLKDVGANIEEFSSDLESAAFTGVDMFRARARLRLPDSLEPADVRRTLERLAGEIMVDLTLADE